MAKIISFDIWDTIIKRKCHPEEIKLATARYIVLKYENKLKEKYKNIYEILKKRDEIEAKECKENKENGFDEECRILDVFKILEKEIFEEEINIEEELLKEEIEQEKKVIYINPEILPIFEKYKDLKMYCISDFYMSSDNLKELFALAQHYGMPTRLLDWTYQFNIALYFGAMDSLEKTKKDFSVWGLNVSLLEDFKNFLLTSKISTY